MVTGRIYAALLTSVCLTLQVIGCGSDERSFLSTASSTITTPHMSTSSQGQAQDNVGSEVPDEDASPHDTRIDVEPLETDGISATSTPTRIALFDTNDGLWHRQVTSPNRITFEDNAVVALTVVGDPMLGPHDTVGPAFATQIATTQAYGYGVYRARVKPASCNADEELVNGIFVYANDGITDANNNGMIDNNEIDMEILCGEPHILWISHWTDYTDDDHFQKVTRAINFATGEIFETTPGQEGTYGIGQTPVDTMAAHPGLNLTADFFEMGFEWLEDSIRYFIVVDNEEITLWSFTDPWFIPQPPAPFMFNVWHTSAHWWSGSTADYPSNNATMQVDWFKYWEAKL